MNEPDEPMHLGYDQRGETRSKPICSTKRRARWGLWKIKEKSWLIDATYKRPYSFQTRKLAAEELKSRYKKGDRTDPFAGYFRNCVIPKRMPINPK